MKNSMRDDLPFPGAMVTIEHTRNGELIYRETSHNIVTDMGRDFIHGMAYATTSPASCGLNYVGLSDDALTETSSSTSLSNEITANGLARAQGTVSHTSGTNTTTITKAFTCTTATQSARKAALFSAATSGIMCHPASFTPRTCEIGDILTVHFTITLG